jgi:iron-sulfur cluster repair protein YtfE (RIC family)
VTCALSQVTGRIGKLSNLGMSGNRSTGRDLAVLLGGIAAGIAGSRMLPPLIAMVNGSNRVRRGHDPFELLIEDHRQILSTLDQMLAEPAESMVKRSSLYLMLKRKLAKHALAEEDVVYPLLHNQGQDAEASKELYDEHADMKILLFELEELLKSGGDWSAQVRSLRDLIQDHVNDEEQVVFPKLRQIFDGSRASKISGQISREEALIL